MGLGDGRCVAGLGVVGSAISFLIVGLAVVGGAIGGGVGVTGGEGVATTTGASVAPATFVGSGVGVTGGEVAGTTTGASVAPLIVGLDETGATVVLLTRVVGFDVGIVVAGVGAA